MPAMWRELMCSLWTFKESFFLSLYYLRKDSLPRRGLRRTFLNAPAVIAKRCPELFHAFKQRQWPLTRSIDRVYDSSLATKYWAGSHTTVLKKSFRNWMRSHLRYYLFEANGRLLNSGVFSSYRLYREVLRERSRNVDCVADIPSIECEDHSMGLDLIQILRQIPQYNFVHA